MTNLNLYCLPVSKQLGSVVEDVCPESSGENITFDVQCLISVCITLSLISQGELFHFTTSHSQPPPTHRVFLFLPPQKRPQRPLHHDERPVCQLRGPEDDRRLGAEPEEGVDPQDPALRDPPPQVSLREAHPGQAGEVLHEEQRDQPVWDPAERNHVIVGRRRRLWRENGEFTPK